jgi:hypothetical protein
MKRSPLIFAGFVTSATLLFAAATPNFSGKYADKKFLKGQAVLQLILEQSGNEVSIYFTAVRNDGQGAAPEIETKGTIGTNGTAQFKFTDDLKNSGTGTIARTGDDVLLSINANHVADSRCLQFYKQNMRLMRVKK